MPPSRLRAHSLQVSIDNTPIWRPPRPPTPRRSTYPQPGMTSADMPVVAAADAPPVPPLSYWEPDTPSPLTTPLSPRNPFLSPPPSRNPAVGFPIAVPLLPASPLSTFDPFVSPTSSVFQYARSVSGPNKDLSPRFLHPRTPPLPPPLVSTVSTILVMKGASAMRATSHTEHEEMRYQSRQDMLMIVQDMIVKEPGAQSAQIEQRSSPSEKGSLIRSFKVPKTEVIGALKASRLKALKQHRRDGSA